MARILHIIGLCALALPVWGGESIVLRTGFRLAADRHEIEGDTIRIFSGDGVTEMPVGLVESVEQVEAPVAPPALVPAPEKPVVSLPPETRTASELSPIELSPIELSPIELSPIELARSAADKYALPDAFVAGVMRAESGFNPAAISPKGAIGLMQLMPETARDLGVDPAKPAENADAGARYLRDLLARYEDKPDQVVLALAAYNAGPAAVEKYHGVPPFRETREYILRVLKAWNPPLDAK